MEPSKKIVFVILFCFCVYTNYASNIKHRVTFDTNVVIDTLSAKDGHVYSTVKFPDCSYSSLEGEPQLPVRNIVLIIPANEEPASITFTKSGGSIISLPYPIVPVQKPIPTSINFKGNEFIPPNPEIYTSDTYLPEELGKLLRAESSRGNKVVIVEVSPLVYNPVKNEIEMYEWIDIDLGLKPSENIPKTAPVRNKRIYDSYLRALVDNDEDLEKFNVIKEKQKNWQLKSAEATQGISIVCDYVIVTPSSLSSYFDDLIEWKRQKGYVVELVTTEDIYQNYQDGDEISGIDDNAGSIRQFLSDACDNGLEFALLAGDSSMVPIRYGWAGSVTMDPLYEIPADLYYCEFEGDWKVDIDTRYGEKGDDDIESSPEIFVGRLLCNNGTQIQNWINKLLLYEQNPGNGNTAYLKKAFYSQADLMQHRDYAGEIATQFSDIFTTDTIFQEMIGDTPIYNSTVCPDFPNGADVINEMNSGYGFISWFNHGAPNCIAVATKGDNNDDCTIGDKKKVTNADSVTTSTWCLYPESGNGLDNLSNSSKPFVLYTVSCETTPFDTWQGIAPTNNLGAQITNLPTKGGPIYLGNTRYGWSPSPLQGIFTNLIKNGTYQLGVAEGRSKMYVNLIFEYYNILSHNLIGCPETEMWTDTPEEFTDAYAARCGNNVIVNTGGVTNCIVSVMTSDDSGEEYWDEKHDSPAQKIFYNVPEPYVVTITKHNFLPKIIYSTEIETGISGSISGSSTVCSGGTSFEISTVPSGSTITWTQSANITRVSAQGANPCTFSPNGSGDGWIHAQVVDKCNNTYNLPNKNVWVGVPIITGIDGSSSAVVSTSEGYHMSYDLDCAATGYYWAVYPYHQGLTINPQTGYDWTNITFPEPDYYTVVAQMENACGWSSYAYKSVTVSGSKSAKAGQSGSSVEEGKNLLISPNPADYEVLIEVVGYESSENEEGWILKVYNEANILIEKIEKLNKGNVIINTQNWVEGVYIVRVLIGEVVLTEKLVIKK